MISALFSMAISHLLFFALHIEGNGSFPKPLSPEKERECFARMAAGDEDARSELTLHNLRLVAHIAKKYYADKEDSDDLISIGTIGLIKAVGTFSYEKGTRFATYAARCIENEILMHFRGERKNAGDVYYNDPTDSESDGIPFLPDPSTDEDALIEHLDESLRAKRLHSLLRSALTPREREILTLRYGLGGKRPLPQREIASRMGISRSYVSRIEKKSLQKLRGAFGEDA